MGLIYIIKNNINKKNYIGQTTQVLEKRWKQHLSLADSGETPLYRAMRKYKKENFYIIPIEEIDNEKLNEREIYWINFYNSIAPNGYNATRGGEGTLKYNHSEIIDYYLSEGKKSMTKTAEYFQCHIQTILNIVKANHLEAQKRGSWSERPIIQLDLNGNFIAEYESITKAAKELSIPICGIQSAANSKTLQKSSHGYQWIYKDSYDITKNYNYKKSNWQKVQCIETEQVFDTVSLAAQWLKENNYELKGDIKGMVGNIRRAIRTDIKAYGYHWKIV